MAQTYYPFPKIQLPLRLIKIVICILAALALFRATAIFVPPGYIGVVYDLGRGVLPTVYKEGLHFAIPLWQRIIFFDARLQEYTMSVVPDEGAVKRDDSLDAPTSDGQQVKVDATVLFRINPDKAPDLLRTIGPDYIDKLIRPISRSQIRMVISRYSAIEIYSEKRQEAENVMTKEIAELLKPKDVLLDKVLLRTVIFSPEYSKAIENKVIAEQRIKQAEFEVKEASQRAEAKVIEAKGLAEAQLLQRQTLTNEYLQLEAIKKWDGKLPSVLGTSGSPFFNIPIKP
jgi:regulator of protease activity HflC (stomatin/prohibitin superfamily)